MERTFDSINSLFCQYVAGNTGSDVTRRGSDPAERLGVARSRLRETMGSFAEEQDG